MSSVNTCTEHLLPAKSPVSLELTKVLELVLLDVLMKTTAAAAARGLDSIAPGDHMCLLYDNDDDYREVMVPFVRQGIEQNQRVLFVTGQRTADAIFESLIGDDSFPLQTAIDSGQLKTLSEKRAYFRDGVFDPDEMIARIEAETEEAIAAGYSALRVTGEMSWALGGVTGADRLVEYEIKVDDFYPHSRALALCCYDMRRFDPDVVLGVLQAHPYAILGTQFCGNVYYMPPAEILSDKASEYRLKRCIENLKTHEAETVALHEAVVEKEKLMRELNHRVKNSLNLLHSLINLKARDGHSTTELAEVRSLIQTMSLVHERLHTEGNVSQIEFADFVRELLHNVVSVFPGPSVAVETHIPETLIEAKRARNLGLVLNELVINAMKHGLGNEDKPRILVRFDRNDDSCALTVSNNGAPFPGHVTFSDPESGGTGTALIASIVEELNGSIELQRTPETEICMEFPISALLPVR